jgi:DNA replication protein DnaC
MIEEVFQLNGEFVVKTTCVECEVEIHSPLVDEDGSAVEPSELVVKSALAMRRTCDECLDRSEAAARAASKRRVLDRLILAARMPASVRGMQFAEMVREGRRGQAVAACQQWALGRSEKPGVYLVGPAGVGKTRLAATAAWARLHWLEQPIRWCSVAQLMGNLNRTFADKERRDALAVLLGNDPLVLDDFDKVNPSDFGRQQIFTAIDSRVLAGVPLLVTANLRLGQIGERFGDPIMSRLAGHCTQFELDGPDRRLELDV